MTTAILTFVLVLLYPGERGLTRISVTYTSHSECQVARVWWASVPGFQVSGCRMKVDVEKANQRA